MTARVLAEHFEKVTVLERDEIEERPVLHKSIPQGNHYHALLLGGQRVLSALFPDFPARIVSAGAVAYRIGSEVAWLLPDGKAYAATGCVREPRDLGFDGFSQSRGVLEHCVRELTREVDSVRLRSGVTVERLLFEADRVGGVAIRDPDGAADLEADLVIDAGGRGSRIPRWLTENGFDRPDETVLGVDFAYSSTKFRLRSAYDGPEHLLIGFGPAPDWPDGAIMGEIEEGLWHISLAGRFGNYPPSDREGFLAFTERLYEPLFHALIKNAEPAAEIASFRYPSSLWRHYERLERFPEGLVVIGDAISSFNPVYGQGMSSAALQVSELKRVLDDRAQQSLGLDGLALDFFPRAARIVSTPWALAAAQDLAFPKTTGERPTDFEAQGRYFDAVNSLAAEDPDVYSQLTEVFNLARPLDDLIKEPLRSRVLQRLS
jgi:2-polyprenyl-6-methoxyphenol hydroxylase-like FAD-dependent oxidoreductase